MKASLGKLVLWIFAVLWSLTMAGMLVAMADRLFPGETLVDPSVYAGVVGGLALLILAGLYAWSRTGELTATAAAGSFPQKLDEPTVGCPTCHAPMQVVGTKKRQGQMVTYLWSCERSHGWSRQGDSPDDSTYPWQACNVGEMMRVLFG